MCEYFTEIVFFYAATFRSFDVEMETEPQKKYKNAHTTNKVGCPGSVS